MFKRKLTYGDWFLILVNLLPLYGVWVSGWDPAQMFLIYCLETIIIGCYNVIKMSIVTLYKRKDRWEYQGGSSIVSGWVFILFFIIHYGFFVFIQTSIFASVSGLVSNTPFGQLTFFKGILSKITPDTKLVLYCFIIMYGLRMTTDFIVSGNYKKTTLGLLMFQPYFRIFIQQFVVILGSMFLEFGIGKIFMLIFVCIKLYGEVFINFDRYLLVAEKKQKLKEMIDMKRKST